METIISEQALIFDFRNSIIKIDALNDFLKLHIEAINDAEKTFTEKYKYGIIISDAFDSVLKEKNIKDQTLQLEIIKDIKLSKGIKISDVADISFSDDCVENEIINKISFKLNDKYNNEFYNPEGVLRKKMMFAEHRKMLAQALLSNLIIIFESYLANVYKILVIKNHEKYIDNKQIYISEIFNKDVNSILHNIVANEVEQNMFDSLKTLEKMKKNSEFNIDRYSKIKNQFEEIYYRRNLYVHNDGIINDRYLSNVDKQYTKGKKINDFLLSDEEYLKKSIKVVKKVICSMFYELINTEVCDGKDAYNYLSIVGFESLCLKEYDISEHIYGILSRHKSFEFIDKAMYQVNYINSLKQQGKNIKNLLDNFDVSIATDNFKIAKLCLQDRFEDVYKLLIASYPTSFNASFIREWPIFINFRESEYYEKFKELHKEDFNEFIFEDNSKIESGVPENNKE